MTIIKNTLEFETLRKHLREKEEKAAEFEQELLESSEYGDVMTYKCYQLKQELEEIELNIDMNEG